MTSFYERLKSGMLLLDGAMGTMLQQRGLAVGDLPEEWNRTRQEEVGSIHRAYVEAGSEAILTNTFGANRIKLKRAGREEMVKEYNHAAAKIARAAAGNRAYVIGDMGPTGKFIEPLGTLKYEEVYEAYKEQVISLKEGGVDGFLVETMADLREIRAAVSAVLENSDLTVAASMTFSAVRDEFRTIMGVGIAGMVAELDRLGCRILGANCGSVSVEQMAKIMVMIRKEANRLNGGNFILLAQPNAGTAKLVDGKTVFPETPGSMAEKTLALKKAGAGIIGGCCGTTPEHIRMIKAALKKI